MSRHQGMPSPANFIATRSLVHYFRLRAPVAARIDANFSNIPPPPNRIFDHRSFSVDRSIDPAAPACLNWPTVKTEFGFRIAQRIVFFAMAGFAQTLQFS